MGRNDVEMERFSTFVSVKLEQEEEGDWQIKGPKNS